MIYLFAGEDTRSKLASLDKFLNSEASGLESFSFGKSDFDPRTLESLYSGLGLFSKKILVILSGILEDPNTLEFILEKLELMGESENTFLFTEGKLKKPILDAFKKARAELNIFELKEEKKERFNNFILANALGARKKLELWIYFRQAIDGGASLEELAGILFWKAKDMILRRNFALFSEEELRNISSRLSYLLPEARSKGQDDEASFEKFILEAL